jgi:hypothetical protein
MTREDFIYDVSNTLDFLPTNDEVNRIIDSFDRVTSNIKQEPRWIPVSEDAPPKGTICLWCNKQGRVFTSEITYRSECSSYVGKHGYFSNGLENYGDIIAWMPLPKPYEPQEK